VTVGGLHTKLLPIEKSSRQKINKETSGLLHTLDQIDMVDIYTVINPTTNTAYGTFSKIQHTLGHKASLN
jgi:hypothetical protein